jgi:hypothetical protein
MNNDPANRGAHTDMGLSRELSKVRVDWPWFVQPTTTRRIYMNLLSGCDALKETVPFIKFGLDNPELVQATEYVGKAMSKFY